MSINILEFEKPIAEVADKIEALQLAASNNPELLSQIDKLKSEQAHLQLHYLAEINKNLLLEEN